jgi:hypothetical protein
VLKFCFLIQKIKYIFFPEKELLLCVKFIGVLSVDEMTPIARGFLWVDFLLTILSLSLFLSFSLFFSFSLSDFVDYE